MAPAPLHVGLNALFYEPDRSAGTETYLRGLVPELALASPATRFTVVTTRKGAAALRDAGWTAFCSIVQFPADEGQRARRLAAEQVRYPVFARRRGWDLLHSLASVAPVVTATPAVITVHDATFFRMATFNAVTTAGMRAIVSTAARRADGLIAVSEAGRDDVVEVLGIPPERFTVVPNGAGRPPGPAAEHAAVRRRLELPHSSRVVLCVAAMRPHKNQELLLRALELLPEDVVLVLVGHREAYAGKLETLARDSGLAGRVRVAGYVADDELEALYELAACAALPTLAEGFGLPALEALRRGVPLACSDIAVLREVGGDVPRYFDPRDPASAARAIAEAMGDAARAEAGRAQAARFTWRAAAEGTLEAYDRALSGATR